MNYLLIILHRGKWKRLQAIIRKWTEFLTLFQQGDFAFQTVGGWPEQSHWLRYGKILQETLDVSDDGLRLRL